MQRFSGGAGHHDLLDEAVPLSQMAEEAFNQNPVAPRDAPTDFAGLAGQLRGGPGGAGGSAPATAAAHGGAPALGAHPQSGRHGKLFNDPVHGAFRLSPACVDIIDTWQFQRLRNLKQLGLTYYVFPGASHNRFEHSLGVAHLAHKFASQLWTAQRAELEEVERRDLRLVELAGLCHDLGHGPFSHVFDREFLRRKGITGWDHEDMGASILEALVDEHHIDSLSRQDIRTVQGMITAGHGGGAQPPAGRRWLYDIVANGRNSIDVDKFDYLERDSRYCGVRIACDFNRIMQFSKVIDDQVCYRYSTYMNLHELFHSRAAMHRQVYTHRKAKAVELMAVDALLEADPALRLSEAIGTPADFCRMDDSVLSWIENYQLFRRLLAPTPEDEAALRSAQAIVGRLRRRDLYRFCSEVLVPKEDVERGTWRPPSEADITGFARGARLDPADLIVSSTCINFSMREKNPLDHVGFFEDFDSTQTRPLRPQDVSYMMSATFQDTVVRVYSRVSAEEHVAAVAEAFERWSRQRFGGRAAASTPRKPPRPPPAAGARQPKRSRELFPPAASAGGGSPAEREQRRTRKG